ncbi:hypothetical protein Tco_0933328 [Tanacetum coccineum]
MGDQYPILTLRDYSRPSHEGYRNTIEIPNGNNVVPLRSDTIRLALLEDLALYDNKSWNDPRDFAKPVKQISFPQDVPSTSDRRLIELENQVQCLMEAHLAPKSSIQVNKIASLCEICSGPHDTQYCMENPEQAFVDYASSRTDEAGGKWYTFKLEQNYLGDTYNPSWKSHPNLRFSKFEADFKQQQSKITNKIDTFLKAINDQMMSGCTLRDDMVKNLKLNPNSTLSTRSYPTRDPQSSSNSFKSVNAIQTCFKSITNIQKDQIQVNTLMVNEIETSKPKEPDESLEDEFANLHLNLPVLEVLAHVPIYDALLDKYIVSLELGKKGSEFIQSIAPEKMKDLRLFILPCRLGDSKDFDTLADLGSCVNLILLNLFKNLKIGLLAEAEDVLELAVKLSRLSL